MSPTQRTLNKLRSDGWLAGVVEKHNTFSGKKNDLYGFVDIVAIKDKETLAVQCTSYSNASSRIKKIEEHENYPIVKNAWRVEIWGWKKCKKIGKNGNIYYRYAPRIVPL